MVELVGGKVVKAEEAGIYDEESIEILRGAGLSAEQARAQIAVVREASSGLPSERALRSRR